MVDPATSDQNSNNIGNAGAQMSYPQGPSGKSEAYVPFLKTAPEAQQENITSYETLPKAEKVEVYSQQENVTSKDNNQDEDVVETPKVVDLRHKDNIVPSQSVTHKVGDNADSITTLADVLEKQFIEGVIEAHQEPN